MVSVVQNSTNSTKQHFFAQSTYQLKLLHVHNGIKALLLSQYHKTDDTLTSLVYIADISATMVLNLIASFLSLSHFNFHLLVTEVPTRHS